MEEKNILWNLYSKKKGKYRFILLDDEPASTYVECVKDFYNFLCVNKKRNYSERYSYRYNHTYEYPHTPNKNSKIAITFKELLKDIKSDLIKKLSSWIADRKFEEINNFNYLFLDKGFWKKIFEVENLETLSDSSLMELRKYHNNILWIPIRTLSNTVEYMCYTNTSKNILWVLNPDASICESIVDSDLRVAVIDQSVCKDSMITNILFSEHVTQNYCKLFEKIHSFQGDNLPVYAKLYVMIGYCFSKKLFDQYESLSPMLFKQMSQIDNYNALDETLKEWFNDYNDLCYWEEIKLLAWVNNKRKQDYALNLSYLTDDMIERLNIKQDMFISVDDKGLKLAHSFSGLMLSDYETEQCPKSFLDVYKNIIVNPDYFANVHRNNFLKLPSQQLLLLRDIDYLEDALESEVKLPIEVYKQALKLRENLKENKYRGNKNMEYHDSVIKAIQHYQIISLICDDNYRELLGNANSVLNELLQNMNDYIDPGSSAAISIFQENDHWYFQICYQEKLHEEYDKGKKILRRGFSQKDIFSIISVGQSSKKSEADKYTGYKGIGFKNVYSVFDLVEIDSNGYHFLLDDSYSVNALDLFNELDEKVIQISSDYNRIVEKTLKKIKNESEAVDIENGKTRTKFPIIQIGNILNKDLYYKSAGTFLPSNTSNNTFIHDEITSIRLRFKDESSIKKSILSQLETTYALKYLEEISFEKNLSKTQLKYAHDHSYHYKMIYLTNCQRLLVHTPSGDKLHTIVPLAGIGQWVVSDHFISVRKKIDGLNYIEDKSSRFLRLKNSEQEGILSDLTISFMKTPVLLDDNGNSIAFCNGYLYVTLPTEQHLGGALHINMPGLETNADRSEIIIYDMENQTQNAKWNKSLLEKVFKINGAFENAFNEFVEINKEDVKNYAFLYVPLGILSSFKAYINPGLNGLNYIPCMTNTGINMRSVNYCNYKSSHLFYLRPYMKKWFEEIDPDFSYFYQLMDPNIEFIYMNDPENWGLIKEYEKSKYDIIRPSNGYFTDQDFFNYIKLFWKHIYDSLSEDNRIDADSIFSKRILYISKNSGITDLYKKWEDWKTQIRARQSDTDDLLKSLIKAICFDVEDFDKYFYFTKMDLKLVGNLHEDIPDDTFEVYKESLYQKEYKDFTKYYSLVVEEISNTPRKPSGRNELSISPHYAIDVYGDRQYNLMNSSGNSLITLSGISKNTILNSCKAIGIKYIHGVLMYFPILLYNNEFIYETDAKLLISLPECLFKENSYKLIQNEEYNNLLSYWIDQKFIVSKANVASSELILTFDQFTDENFSKSLPDNDCCEMFLKMVMKYESLIKKPLFKKFIKFLYCKTIYGGINSKKLFFELLLIAMNSYIHTVVGKTLNNTSDEDVPSYEIQFDLNMLSYKKNVRLCNSVNHLLDSHKSKKNNKGSTIDKSDFSSASIVDQLLDSDESKKDNIEIIINRSDFSSDSRYYWNEISQKMTEDDRIKIATHFLNHKIENAADIEKGINVFLDRVLLDSSVSSGKNGYPYNQYLLTRNSYSHDRYYVLFSDYTNAFVGLLSKEFDIKISQKKIAAIHNTFDYNELLPIGTTEDYEYVSNHLIPIFDKYHSKIDNELVEDEKKRLEKSFQQFKESLLSLQFSLEDNKAIRGYGKKCPFVKSINVLEKESLQVFSFPIFGFHIGITLISSKDIMDYILRYNSSFKVSIINSSIKKRKTRRSKRNILFTYENGIYYSHDKHWDFSGINKDDDNWLIISVVNTIINLLEDIDNNLLFEIQAVSKTGEVKTYSTTLELTIAHRSLMIYELKKDIERISKNFI